MNCLSWNDKQKKHENKADKNALRVLHESYSTNYHFLLGSSWNSSHVNFVATNRSGLFYSSQAHKRRLVSLKEIITEGTTRG